MNPEILTIASIIIGLLSIIMIAFLLRRVSALSEKIGLQTMTISKMQSALKSRAATNSVAQNAEIIYQDLLQHLTPIAAAANISPRQTQEHPLWRIAGGLMDEYAKNPYVLEQIRQAIKLDSSVARASDTYGEHASKFLDYLAATDTDGLLSATFSDGLLGQTMTLIAQARQLAQN
jgi:hypothetical protein